jgi:hypothetical protein
MKTPTNLEIIASLNEQIEQWRNGSKRSCSCQAEIDRHQAENKLLRHERDEARGQVATLRYRLQMDAFTRRLAK